MTITILKKLKLAAGSYPSLTTMVYDSDITLWGAPYVAVGDHASTVIHA